MKRKIKINVFKILIYIFTLLLVLTTNSVYNNLVDYNFHLPFIFVFIEFLIIFYQIMKGNFDRKKFKNIIVFIFMYIVIVSITMFISKPFDLTNFISRFIIIFPLSLIMFYCLKNKKEFITLLCDAFINIMFFISVTSLLLYIFGPILGILEPSGYIGVHWGGAKLIKSYYNIYFNRQTFYSRYFSIARNSSIFNEAPMYALNLTIAFALLNLKEKQHKFKYLLFIISILSTLSTISIVISSVIIFVKFLKSKNKNQLLNLLKILFIPLLAGSLFFISSSFINIRKNTSSYDARLDDYRASFKTFKENPFFGVGYQNETEIIENMQYDRKDKNGDYNIGISNSFGLLLAECGLILFVFQLIGCINLFIKSLKNKNYINIYFYVVIISLYFTMIFAYTPLLFVLLAYTFSPFLEEKNNYEKN